MRTDLVWRREESSLWELRIPLQLNWRIELAGAAGLGGRRDVEAHERRRRIWGRGGGSEGRRGRRGTILTLGVGGSGGMGGFGRVENMVQEAYRKWGLWVLGERVAGRERVQG